MLRENLSMSDYGYAPGKDVSAVENSGENVSEEKQDGWTSSENMVISIDPFSHNEYGNPGNTPQSEHQPEESGMRIVTNIQEHIKVRLY